MFYDRIVVKYGELSIKGKNRNQFIKRMIQTIKYKCRKLERIQFDIQPQRLYIILNGEDPQKVIACLNQVFGIHAYSLAVKATLDMDAIKSLATELIQHEITEPVTFKVETHRSYKAFPLTSLEISKEVAAHVLKHTNMLTVDVKKPEVTLLVDVRADGVYLSLKDIKGLGGLPIGVDGKGLLMISGGIDSPVAGFMMQKRGLYLEAIHFASPPYTSVQSKQKVIDLLQKIAVYHPNGKLKLHVVPFTELQKAIYQYCPDHYGITLMRRMMYRISEIVAKQNDCKVIVNGESLGQVASQTIDSMYAINDVTSMPVLRPLVAFDKMEIIEIATKIGTYDISILPYEDCCTVFVPKHPVIKPDLTKIYQFEQGFDFNALIKKAIENIETIMIDEDKKIDLLLEEKINDLF